jgi:chromosome segregation ATPase
MMCQDFHADAARQARLIVGLKSHLELRGDELKSSRSEVDGLKDEVLEARADVSRLERQLQAVRSELLEVRRVHLPWYGLERTRMNNLLARCELARENLNKELKGLKDKFRDLTVKYASLKEVAMSQSIDKVRKFLELSID